MLALGEDAISSFMAWKTQQLQELGRLHALVSSARGPCARTKVFLRGAGSVTVTSHSQRLLESLGCVAGAPRGPREAVYRVTQ